LVSIDVLVLTEQVQPRVLRKTGNGNIVCIGIAYDTADFGAECRNLKVTPHVAQNWTGPMLVRRSTPDMPSVRGKGNALKSAWDG
jgi:hypothetical protein